MPVPIAAMVAMEVLRAAPTIVGMFAKDKSMRLGVNQRGRVGDINYGEGFKAGERGTSPEDYFSWLSARQASESQQNNAPLLAGLSKRFQQGLALPGATRRTRFNPYGRQSGAPRITALAHGGIVTEPTIGLIGEAGPEAVIPLRPGGNQSTFAQRPGGQDNPSVFNLGSQPSIPNPMFNGTTVAPPPPPPPPPPGNPLFNGTTVAPPPPRTPNPIFNGNGVYSGGGYDGSGINPSADGARPTTVVQPPPPPPGGDPLFTPAQDFSRDQGGTGGYTRDFDKQAMLDQAMGRHTSQTNGGMGNGGVGGSGGGGMNDYVPPVGGGGGSGVNDYVPSVGGTSGGGSGAAGNYGVPPGTGIDGPLDPLDDAETEDDGLELLGDDTDYEETDYGPGALPDYAEMAGNIPGAEVFAGANPNAQRGYSDDVFRRMSDRIIGTANENAGARGAFGGSANQQSIYEGLTPLALASEQFGQDQSNDSFNQALQTFGINTGQKQQRFNNQQGLQQNYFNQGQQLNNMNNQQKDQYMQQLYQYLGLGGGAQNPMFT